jgi:hypothetical protein
MNAMKRGGEECDDVELGGVNHCSVHCRLAKFRGLKSRGKYGAVIGPKAPVTHCRLHCPGTPSHTVAWWAWRAVLHCRTWRLHTVDLGLDTLSPTLSFSKCWRPTATHSSAVFPPSLQTTEFCQTIVYTTVVGPSHRTRAKCLGRAKRSGHFVCQKIYSPSQTPIMRTLMERGGKASKGISSSFGVH